MKSPLMERPTLHHVTRRVETHIFLCVLAYHLLVTIEKTFLDQGIHTSWALLREQLGTLPQGAIRGLEDADIICENLVELYRKCILPCA
jgi:hypothetical protein